ncbi:MAG: glycosyltransferase family 4 protein [Rhodococcus sp.]|nr:glycosyltransferase family 4 protein [Rhodococcus sp. (in: high G+C Gram-positive bacteria)]MBJ7323338.1 glycosyltransferase family 4 protein [Rhodococcus sp. (in: high G+C Gram-positive bacteria)]
MAIIHPWMPQYRTKFFSLLVSELEARGVELVIFYGETPPEWKERNDSASPEYCIELDTRFRSIGGRSIAAKSLVEFYRHGPYDLIVLEQAIRNLETYRLFASRTTRSAIAFWGHGKTYTARKNLFEEWFKLFLTRRTRWFFAYTQGGVDALVAGGFDSRRTTVVQNSTDTELLKDALATVSSADVDRFRLEHRLGEDLCVYIGGIDSAKRIPFLLDAAHACYRSNPKFHLVIIGAGDLSKHVKESSEAFSYISYLGAVFGFEKAVALKACRLMLIPGRVGLVAVDSLVAGSPIVTTDWPYHAPEFEYLEDGVTALVASDSVDGYSKTVLEILADGRRLSELSANCIDVGSEFSAERMAMRFSVGVMDALDV